MKKLMPFIGGALLAVFALAVGAVVISLSFRALGLIFPNDLFDQVIGLILFDAAALIWFIIFIYLSYSTMQYVFSFFGFLVGLGGTIGLVSIEVSISSGLVQAADVLKPLTYVFIAVAVGHVVLLYARHAAAPEVNAKIALGVEKAKIHNEGMRQAELQLVKEMQQLGDVIRSRLVDEVLQDLNMTPRLLHSNLLPVDDSLHTPSNRYPMPTQEKPISFFENPMEWFQRKLRGNEKDPQINEQAISQEKLPEQEQIAESMAQSSDALMAWRNQPDGSRFRIFCKICKTEGKPWFTDEACEHVQRGIPEKELNTEEVVRMLMEIFAEEEQPAG